MTARPQGRDGRDRLCLHARRLALVVVAVAVLVLAGWVGGVEVLVRVRSHYSAMVPETAIAFILAGLGLALCAERPAGWRAAAGAGLAVLVGAIAVLNMLPVAERLGGGPLALLTSAPGQADRMAIGTEASLLLAAFVIFGVARPRAVPPALFQVVATVGLLASLVAVTGYVTGAAALYGTYVFTAMSLQTALSFLVLFLAVLLARPRETWLGLLFGPSGGGRTARRLMPWFAGGPLLLAALARAATTYGVLTPDVRFGLFVVALLVVSVSALVFSARVADQIERQQIREGQRLASILEGINAAVFAIDATDATIRFTNRRALTMTGAAGSPAEWFATAHFVDPVTFEPLAERLRPLARVAVGAAVDHEVVGLLEGGDGGERVLRMSAGPAVEIAGRATRVLAIADVTDEQTLRERLARAERLDALGQLSGGIAHDMANVLGIIRLSADVGVRSDDPERMRRQFEAIQAAVLRGADLTSRILAFARRQPEQTGVVDLVAFVRQLYRLARRTIPSSIEFDLALDVAEGEALVFAAASQLESAVLNLILNARNAIVENDGTPRIVVGVRRPANGTVTMFVRDEGPGMSPQVLRQATDPFFTTRKEAGGTGLGLAIVQSFVEDAHGTMAIRSAPGEGTEVTLMLPRAEALPDAQEIAASGPEDLSGLSVMLVEDDPGYQSVLVLALTASAADVFAYRTAGEAIAALDEGLRCSVLLTDVILRGGSNGFAVANHARALHPDLPVIYLSGYADTAAQAEHHTPGTFLRKPISGPDLTREILRACHGHP